MRSGGAERPRRSPFIWILVLLPGPRDSDRRERSGLFDRDLTGAARSSSARKATACSTRERLAHLLVEVETGAAPQHGAEPLEELRHRREAERHVRERDLRRILREEPDHSRELLGLLRRERHLDLRRERRRAEPEETVALRLEPLPEPAGGVLHPPVLRETPRELLGGRLRLELGELGGLLREEPAGLQLEERRDQDEELAAGLEVELVALEEVLDEGEDDPRDVDLAQSSSSFRTSVSSRSNGPSNASRSSSSSRHDHAAT